MKADEFERRLRALALREGMTFATLIGLDPEDRAVLQATILAGFAGDLAYGERQVNERLKAWLAGVGSMLETDHVTLRRLLIDTQILRRTTDCAQYRVAPEALARVRPELLALDAEGISRDARREDAERRSARKAAWQARAGAGKAETA